MKNLLVATDLSPRSDRAVARALRLSQQHDVPLTVLHVIDDTLPSTVADRLKDDATAAIEEQIGEGESFDRRRVSVQVAFDSPHRAIVAAAQALAADLIVMGTPREDTLRDFFVGTTVERVIRRGNHPILVVRDRVKGAYRKVLVGIDFSVYARRAVEFAARIAPDSKVTLLHAYELPFKNFLSGHSRRDSVSKQQQVQVDAMLNEELAAFLASLPPEAAPANTAMTEGVVWDVLRAGVREMRADLLVLGTHGRTGAVHALLGSVAQDLLSDPPCDVLAVKAW